MPDKKPSHNPEMDWRAEPGQRELFLLIVLGAALFGTTLIALQGWHFFSCGDNIAYLQVATAIRHWDLHGLGDVQQFMGYPYAVALFSLVLHLPLVVSLLVVAGAASLVGTFGVARLFGTRVAAYFAICNFAWWQASLLGGSEPLAVAFGMGAFLSFRRGHPVLAALLGALATVVRPLMIFTLVGIGIVLLCRKRFAEFLGALGVGLSIGILYILPLWQYFGDPFLTVRSYVSRDYGAAMVTGAHGHLFSWPLHAIIAGTLLYPAPWSNLLLSFAWIGLVIAGIAAIFLPDFRAYAKANPAEVVFCGLYLLSIFCYGYFVWARGNFMRFSIPALPFIFFAVLRWLPKDRRILWCIGVIAPVLAALSAIGIRNVFLLR